MSFDAIEAVRIGAWIIFGAVVASFSARELAHRSETEHQRALAHAHELLAACHASKLPVKLHPTIAPLDAPPPGAVPPPRSPEMQKLCDAPWKQYGAERCGYVCGPWLSSYECDPL